MDDIFSLDLETKSLDPANPQYALEPFRLSQGLIKITDLSVYGPDNFNKYIKDPSKEETISVLRFLHKKTTYMHNSVYDLSLLYALVEDINLLTNIDVRDTMLLAKWIVNSQREQFKTKAMKDELGGLDLASLIKRFLPKDTPDIDLFLDMKREDHVAGEDAEYWSKRAVFDALFTRLLAIELQKILPEIQRNGFLISQKQLPYVARAYIHGAPFDYEKVKELTPKIDAAKRSIARKIGLDISVLQSPSQLSVVLFEDWELNPISRGKPKKGYPNGQGSTKADDLKMIALQSQGTKHGPKMKLIMDFKKLQTLQSKYVNGFNRVVDYVGEPVCHASPRVFGTYTGRYTYSSKTLKKDAFQISIAMHQLPQKGPAKALVTAPEDMDVGKYDASGQEIAFMAFASSDRNMLGVLNQGMNVHSWMATNINGMQYDDFVKIVKSGDDNAYNIRQAAKLLNLSCQYRIGWKAIQAKFFSRYDQIISRVQANQYLKIYKIAYPGVVDYWKSIAKESEEKGYAETIARRRYYLTDWDTHRWSTESSAINTPVQGSGADQKDLVIWLVSEKFPEAIFIQDIHDEGVFFLPKKYSEELNKEIVHFLNGIDYEFYWQREVPMPLSFEGQLGSNFKDCKEYAQSFEDIQKMKENMKSTLN